ncbi:MAG: hypothetical protein JNG88_09770 [Phycisphaerales bacterium]|nr:hypothetical protein [Phycisphaerales bacterium]
MTRRFSWLPVGGLILAAILANGAITLAADEPASEPGVISGTMDIDFKTRTTPDTSGELAEGSAAKGVQDKYTFSFVVGKTTEFSGSIVRQPNLFTKGIRKRIQGAALGFDVTLSVLNPKDLKQKKSVGKWVGVLPINTETGAYDLAGGKKEERPLRIAIDAVGSGKAFTDQFAGILMGKAEKKDNLAQYTYKRLVGKKTVEIVVKKSDPMRFDNVELAKGPSENYPRTVVNGRLDYDYETGNWFTDGIRFKYALDGKDFEDVITGSIKWVEDPNRATNGKGYYEFNLRFNEEKNKPAASEAAAFDKMSDEEAFFAVDDTIPCMTGRIEYVDTMSSGSDAPSSSKVTYTLNSNKLTKVQVMNFFKLWLVCIGPTNDE